MRRRHILQALAALGGAVLLPPVGATLAGGGALLRRIPASGEMIPAIGMGTWLTFDVGDDERERAVRCEVMKAFFDLGGRVIDSSPMYGTSEAVIGECLQRLAGQAQPFAAGKVWSYGRRLGLAQMAHSRMLWGVKRFDLMQVHNLLDWEGHLESLRQMKAEGSIRYIGLTTSHGRRHDELKKILMSEDALDFVQITYNIADREGEQRLLPLAAERGIAVIANRPFQGGALFERVRGKPLPRWAGEFGCDSWAHFFLSFILSHPAVTCAIPATRRVDHLQQNMAALYTPQPDAATRQRMAVFIERL